LRSVSCFAASIGGTRRLLKAASSRRNGPKARAAA
jgi:hypothetical protein